MEQETGEGWTADELVAELDRRLEVGRLSIPAHKREVAAVRTAERAGRRLPRLPRHDSPGWMVRIEQDSAKRKERRQERRAAAAPSPGVEASQRTSVAKKPGRGFWNAFDRASENW